MTGERDRGASIAHISNALDSSLITSLHSSDQTLQVFLIGGGRSFLISLFDTCGGES